MGNSNSSLQQGHRLRFNPILFYLAASLFFNYFPVFAQQEPDLKYSPPIAVPAYANNEGPRVGIDEAHHNFHTVEGRYKPFAKLLRRDGYVVEGFRESFSKDSLENLDVLVIANPLHKRNDGNWSLPTPSAFSVKEIAALHAWVEAGGSLFLIADHMPFPGAAGDLAESFGITFSNGNAQLGNSKKGNPDVFESGTGLIDCAVTQGRTREEKINKVVTFTGSAFKVPEGAQAVLVFQADAMSLEPEVAWKFSNETPKVKIDGWCQGAILEVVKGRLAVFGEAAMFTAQLAGPDQRRIGMSAPYADQNHQLLLNVMHWLTDLPGMGEL